jgi:hypothetical protein
MVGGEIPAAMEALLKWENQQLKYVWDFPANHV